MQVTDTANSKLLSENELLPRLINHYIHQGNPFTLWRMPNSNEKHLLVSTDGTIELEDLSLEESQTGFVFAPFDTAKKKIFFKGNLIYTFKNGELAEGNIPEHIHSKKKVAIENSELPTKQKEKVVIESSSSYHFIELVKKSIALIEIGGVEKVVPSRSKEVALAADFDCFKTFQKLCIAYPNAMVSMVSSDATGTWIGASPELLVSLDEQAHFKTVALAGTKRVEAGVNIKSVAWNEKEIEEQALVCRYIISCLKKIRLREYEERGPRTALAGNLLHLKTEFEVDTVATNFPLLASVMLKLLHPTSAVCGMPLEKAQQFLKANEGYDREFYSGFSGPINFKNESHVYVNLRCMQVLNKTALLYAGAGVTIDSDPENEFQETELKMEALLKIISEA
jgi:isochorismate synthase